MLKCRVTFLWSHNPHFLQEIILFLTGLAHTEHGYFTDPGCKFMSPDNLIRYLKYEWCLENFSLVRA